MKKIISVTLFFLIFFLGTFLRFYQLGSIPNSLDWDEASWGYNAYAILHTGKDEYGNFLPLSFKAFGDYKQPVYVYAEVLPIKIFGLNAFSVRFPSAFFGSLSIVFIFLLTRELLRKKQYTNVISYVVTLLFAISPWSIQFSRVAFESTVGLFFVLLGIWIFLIALREEKIWKFIISLFFIAISAYTYHSEKLFSPLLFIGLLFYGKNFFLKKKKILALVCLVFLFFNIFWLLDSRTTARGKSVLFTSDQTTILKHSLVEQTQDGKGLLGLAHNRRVIFVEKFVQNYLDHFDPNWLFIQGDLARHHAPDFGLLYLASLPFLLIGVYSLIIYERKIALLLGYWMMLAPISGALVTGAPNAERALIMLPIFLIAEAFGWVYFIALARKKFLFLIVISFSIALYIFNFGLYVHQYFLHTNTEYDRYWQYGYEQAILYAAKPANQTKKIIFSSTVEQGYVFFLFYAKIDPAKYIAQGGSRILEKQCYAIENAYFGACQLQPGDLYMSAKPTVDPHYTKIDQVNFFAGDPAIYIYEFKQ